jgi:prepilin-type N-terminal cleavage/methylation domain-containing protein
MKKLNLKKGFTLIELLVVVAIIGILASVVLASLNTARAKGSDAAIKANLDNMRAQAAIDYDTGSTYGTTVGTAIACTVTSAGVVSGCTGPFLSDVTVQSALKQAASSSGSTVYAAVDTTNQLYAITANLKASSGNYWCVDSAGKSLSESGSASSLTACP